MPGSVVEHVKRLRDRPWLIVGKGPSFRAWDPAMQDRYRIIALNHVCQKLTPDIAHFTDMPAFLDCVNDVFWRRVERPPAVAMPWYPHEDNKPGRCLNEHLACNGILRTLDAKQRLLSYNSSLASKLPQHKRLPFIYVRYFSAVAAVSILCAAGVNVIRTLGIDGGAAYASDFDSRTLLSNGRSSFDVQFEAIDSVLHKHGATLKSLAPEAADGRRP